MLALSAFGAPPGIRSPTQGVELVDRPDPLRRQVRPPLLQQSEDHRVALRDDYRCVALKCCNARGRSGVDHVVLASPTPGSSHTRAVAAVDASSTVSSWATSHCAR